jgi:hypothetical protein
LIRVRASELVLQFEQGRPLSEIPRWWQQLQQLDTAADTSLAVIEASFGGAYPSIPDVAKKLEPLVGGSVWQCAACERSLQRCKQAESTVQRTNTLAQDRRGSNGGAAAASRLVSVSV